MTDNVAALPATPRWKIVLLQLIFVYLLALKLGYDIAAMPMGDEAYYWMWGQHLSWSYFDHPPLDGWLQGLVATIFGWSNLSVRLLTWVTLGGSLWILWLWSERLAPTDRVGWFWSTAVVYLCMPVIFLMTTGALHDHLLIALSMASVYFFHGFATSVEDSNTRWRQLYVAALFLGLAVLTKYNGVFVGIGYACWILLRPKLRPLLVDLRLWGAALFAIALQAPVFYWNLTEGFASFRFHLSGRGIDFSNPQPLQALAFIGGVMISISPILFGSLFRIPFLERGTRDQSSALSLSSTLFLVSTICWTAFALFVVVYFHWNVVAYAALAPIAYRLLGGRVAFWLHVLYGLTIITFAMLNYIVTPITFLGLSDPGAPADFGWSELATEIEKQSTGHPGAFLAATRYTYAAQLGFVLHKTDVAAFNPIPSQNDYWWNATAHAGQDALILADRAFPIDNAKSKFASLQKLEDVPVVSFGRTVWTFEIWLGKDFGHGSE